MIKIICIAAVIALSSSQIKFLHASEYESDASDLKVTQYELFEDGRRENYIDFYFPYKFKVEIVLNQVNLIAHNLNDKIKNYLWEASQAIEDNFISYAIFFDGSEGKITIETKNDDVKHFYKSGSIQVNGIRIVVTLESVIAKNQYAEFEFIIYDQALKHKVLNLLKL